MRVAVFRDYYATVPEYTDLDDADGLMRHLGAHTETATKEEVPLFSPAEFTGTRSAASVRRLHFAVLDVDKVTEEKLVRALTELRERGLYWMAYSTWSNTKYTKRDGRLAVRLVLPLSRPVWADEWMMFWARVNTLIGGIADAQCKDPSRTYHYPSCPIGDSENAILMCEQGILLPVDEILSVPVSPAPDTRVGSVSPADVRALAARLVRRTKSNDRMVGERLRRIASGESFAEPGERDETIFRITAVLVREFPRASAEALADLFVQSLAVMSAHQPDCPTRELVAYKVRRHQTTLDADALDQESQALGRYHRMLRDLGRTEPYTEEEAQQWVERMGVPDMAGRWVVQKDRAYWFMVNGNYVGPFTHAEATEAAETRLCPARPLGIQVWEDGAQGARRLKISDLVSRFGSVADKIVVDLAAQFTSYRDWVLTEAPCPKRKFDAVRHEEVDLWLRAMAGDRAEKLLDWIAVVSILDEPCAALYLEGPKGVGKGLLAIGLSRLWTTQGPTPLEKVLGTSYNTLITECPLLFADEIFPTDQRGRPMTGELRQLVQLRNHTISEKWITDRKVHGCLRVLIAANNRSLLSGNADLTRHDIDAIVDRILHVPVCSDGEAFLDTLNPTTRQRMADHAIAEHAEWLRENRVVQRGHRFLVSGDRAALHRTLTVDTGLRSAVCNWLVLYLLDPAKVQATGSLLVRVDGGSVLATARGLQTMWDLYRTNTKPPQTASISRALSGLASGKRPMSDEAGVRTNYWVLDSVNLATWAENHGYAVEDQVYDILAQWDDDLLAHRAARS